MWFGYNCWIIFYHFFQFVNLVIFRPQCIDSGYLVSATPHTILYQSFWNLAHVFSLVWRCAYGLDIILAFIFVTFSTLRTLSFSDLRFYENVVTVGTLWAQLLIQFYTDLYETAHVFAMVWRCACGLDIILELIFVTFSTLWTLSFLTSDSMKVYRQGLPCKRNSLYNFMTLYATLHIFFSMVWRCACGLDLILQLFLSLFYFVNFVSFRRCDINFTEVRSILFHST